MRVMVLGCGPAGLMATHAAAQADADILVFSKARKSRLYGCQYLHAPIPGATRLGPVPVSYNLEGTLEQYREKVYGSRSNLPVSPETLEEDHLAWDIRQTYDSLWDMYGPFVQNVDLAGFGDRPSDYVHHLIETFQPDVTLSTVPAPILCDGSHGFASEDVWAVGDAPEEGQTVPFHVPENTILCDGTSDHSWYRASNVFGYGTIEWPGRLRGKPPFEGVVQVTKPLKTNCTCHPEVHRLGRYGKWTKGVLSHEAYFETQQILEKVKALGIQGELEL